MTSTRNDADTSVIVAAARTPVGRLMGALSGLPATELGAAAVRGALERGGVDPADVDYVIMGQVLTAGAGQMPARQTSVAAGIGWNVPALSINKMCLSGIDAIALADQLIRAGEFDVVAAGGQESMSQAPHLLMGSRSGTKYGNAELVDHTAYDGLHDVFTDQPMGALTEDHNSFSREEQDASAAASHQRAADAQAQGRFAEEIVPITIPQRRGDDIVVSADEGVRGSTTPESLAALRPAFAENGTITAGNASQISDGAAAVVVMRKSKAIELGLEWLAEIGAHGNVAGPDSSLQRQPSTAILAAVAAQGIDVADIDLFEINEAFAAVSLTAMKELGVSDEIVNVDGGAIAIGHPIGASGARIVVHLIHELRRRGGGIGAAALCGAGGQGDALILTVPAK
ncbi:acetyl-CoA C-acetyltransferase [Gordonia humi]|uniref:Probable acetyl-CoA acetyltransferase n=1 Tax=Gordonia humi TaxID=686429 RepID=A0A840F7A5_9ACTN|nr:acetyl-CoA C-acetyltransferase [Gordonia humi]MBB4137766.1 acetyl-CoA C-acetyltransferase [Gordonia humi]